MSQREALLKATTDLIWTFGFEAMSPKMILRESGAGQGSMYHHFSGKKQLAIEAMKQHEDLLLESMVEQLSGAGSPLQRLRSWLNTNRDALGGCRLGRLANEHAVRTDSELREPLQRYFTTLHDTLTRVLIQAQQAGECTSQPPAPQLASMLIAVVQGGYILSLATDEPQHLKQATLAAEQLLNTL